VAALICALEKHAFRLMSDRKLAEASRDWTEINELLDANPAIVEPQEAARLYRWVGFFQHVHFDLKAAVATYDKADSLHPCADNLVKKSGVLIDDGKVDEASKYVFP
jgi:hypothetical protein